MLPHRHGHRALLRRARRGGSRRALTGLLAIGLVAGIGLAVPLAAGAKEGDTWTPSDWTGEVAGPPVPGTGLPAAAAPAIPVALPEGYDVAPTYEGQAQCDPEAKVGTQRLADLIKATYGSTQTVWIPRACDVGGQSEHKEGRALDWMTSVRDPQQRANAETFLAWLLGPDQFGTPYGNAMRLGVMYIGWNDRIWRGYDTKRGWTELKGCFATPNEGSDTVCHRNHIHISMTWDGASGRTSFWDGTPMDGPYCKPARSSASIPGGGRAADMIPVEPVKVLGTRKALGRAGAVPPAAGPLQRRQPSHLREGHRPGRHPGHRRGRRRRPGDGDGVERARQRPDLGAGPVQEPGRRQGPDEHGRRRDGHRARGE